jgi:hypothetical protein
MSGLLCELSAFSQKLRWLLVASFQLSLFAIPNRRFSPMRNLLLVSIVGEFAVTEMTDVLVKLQSEGPGRIPYMRCPFQR